MRYAIIDDSTKIVKGVIIWDGQSDFKKPEGTSLLNVDNIPCGPDWIQQEDGTFTPPPTEE